MLGMSSSSQGQAGGTAEQGARQHELVAKVRRQKNTWVGAVPLR